MGLLRHRPPKVDKFKKRGDVGGLVQALNYVESHADREGGEADRGVPVRAAAAAALGPFDALAVSEALVQALRDPHESVRYNARTTLIQHGLRRAVDPLCTAVVTWVEPDQTFARGDVLAALETMSDRELLPRVLGALMVRPAGLGDSDRLVVQRLAQSAPEGLPQAIEQLLSELGEGESGARAGKALVWLAPASVEPLINALGQEDERERAALALGYTHDRRAVEPLCRLLVENPDPAVRRVAAWALGEIRDLAAVEALLLASSDADYDVRTEASSAFDQFGNVGITVALSTLRPPALPSGTQASGSQPEDAEGDYSVPEPDPPPEPTLEPPPNRPPARLAYRRLFGRRPER